MNDFDYDVMQKKRIGRGAFSRKGTVNQKGCRLPHENLTKKEREALNGEVKTVGLNDKITWEFFKALPKDLQEEYLNHLIKRFGVGLATIGQDLFGLQKSALGNHANRKGLNIVNHTCGRIPRAALNIWHRWLDDEHKIAPVSEQIRNYDKEARDLLNNYPELIGKSLPEEVYKMAVSEDITLLDAYEKTLMTDSPAKEPEPEVKPFRAHDFEDLFKEMGMERETTPTLSGDEEDSENVNFYPLTDLSMTLKGTPIDVIATLRMSFPALLDKDTQYRFTVKVDKYVL